MMYQSSDNSQLCIDSQYSSKQLTIVWTLIHHSTQPILIFSKARVLHLDRLKEGTLFHSFGWNKRWFAARHSVLSVCEVSLIPFFLFVTVLFITKIYHPNIDTSGRICLDLLKMPPQGSWKPNLNISLILKSIGLLLAEPNPGT